MTDIEKYASNANILAEALPYIKEFSGKTIVLKYGGSSMDEDKITKTIEDIVLLKLVGMNVVIVHGGGPYITEMLEKLNIQSSFVKGLRVTTQETMDIVEMVLSGKVNKNIVKLIQMHDVKAVGISGVDGQLIQAKKLEIEEGDIGFVGEITAINGDLITAIVEDGFIPVIAPIGVDQAGNRYNINADYTAVAIAKAISAEKLIFMTDVLGVMTDLNDTDSLLTELSIAKAKQYITDEVIQGGMIPKIDCCINAVEEGIKHVHIIDGTIEHSLILELLTKAGIGTLIHKG